MKIKPSSNARPVASFIAGAVVGMALIILAAPAQRQDALDYSAMTCDELRAPGIPREVYFYWCEGADY